MASSETSICNESLDLVGNKPIVSLADASAAGRACNRNYASIRDWLLAQYRWNFSITRENLSSDPDAPAFGFGFKHRLPSNCLKFIGIYDENEPQQNYTSSTIRYKNESGFILSDEDGALPVFFVRKITDPNEFDPLFHQALVTALAVRISRPVSADKADREAAVASFNALIKTARRENAIQTMPEEVRAETWLDSRFDMRGPRVGPVA